MKFIVNSSKLLKQLVSIQNVIQASSVISILENFLFILENKNLYVIASDMETTVKVHIPVESEDTGNICVPSKILIDTLKNLPEQPLTFKINIENSSIETSSSTGKYKITGEKAEDYPKVPQATSTSGLEISTESFVSAIAKVLIAVSNDDMKPEMNGVLFEIKKDYLRFVSTDSHRLIRYTLSDVKGNDDKQIILPKKPLNLLKNILSAYLTENLKIQYNNNHFFLQVDTFEMSCRLIDAKYPDYTVVIPDRNPFTLVLNKSEFQSSLNRLSVFSNKSTHMVKLELKGQSLHMSAQDLDYAFEGEENLQCKFEGDDMEIGFNSKFLVELLHPIETEDVQIQLSSSSKPGLIMPIENEENSELVILLMPLMLGKS